MATSNLSYINLPFNTTFSFVVLTKLDENDYLVLKSQVFPSIYCNGLENFINRERIVPNCFSYGVSNGQMIENPECLVKTRSIALKVA